MTRTGRPLAMPVEDRKKEIYVAAEMLFGERGYEKVTMAQIAAQAGMSKKTLYVYFADKEALLTSLVASSYIWPENAFGQEVADSVDNLKIRLKVIAEHVLSARHLKLCRLAIAERVGIAGLADTFYKMGIRSSRQSLITAIEQIGSSRRMVKLNASILADMMFGATVGPVLVETLFRGGEPDIKAVYATIEHTVAALFKVGRVERV